MHLSFIHRGLKDILLMVMTPLLDDHRFILFNMDTNLLVSSILGQGALDLTGNTKLDAGQYILCSLWKKTTSFLLSRVVQNSIRINICSLCVFLFIIASPACSFVICVVNRILGDFLAEFGGANSEDIYRILCRECEWEAFERRTKILPHENIR